MGKYKGKKGFTLIELLIVVAIIGIVAAIAVPNLLVAIQKSKQKATIGDLKTIGNAIGAYATDNYIAPSDLSFGPDSVRVLYIRNFPTTDSWGNEWSYTRNTNDMNIYSVASGGKDGTFNGWNQSGAYIMSSYFDFNYDIIFSVGIFTYGPKIK